jgi:hypothetical protein
MFIIDCLMHGRYCLALYYISAERRASRVACGSVVALGEWLTRLPSVPARRRFHSEYKGCVKPNIEPGGFSGPQIMCKITNYHRPIGRILNGFGHWLQVKNCLN